MFSFLPERPIFLFPSLALSIGLEEAVLLSLLHEISAHKFAQYKQTHYWYELEEQEIKKHMPFWDDLDIQRISQSLCDLDVISLSSAPYSQIRKLKFVFNQRGIANIKGAVTVAPLTNRINTSPISNSDDGHRHTKKSQGATLLPPNWQPNRDTVRILEQINIPGNFIREQLPEFVHYWRERGESHRTWGAKFIQHLKWKWTHHVSKTSNSTILPNPWQPSDILQQQIMSEGIPAVFVQKSLRRFSLYHAHSGVSNRNWDMPFFSWLKEDWEKQDAPFLDKKKSTTISPDWGPDKHTLTFLTVSHGIELSFINESVPEFVHKWIEKKAIYSEWGSIFAEHVIQQWHFVQAGVTRNPYPEVIPSNWKPSVGCLDMLDVYSGIDKKFIHQQIPEFILYWKNRSQPMHSWDNIFLRHVKNQWKQQHERQQSPSGTDNTKDRPLIDDLTDTSWAG